MRLLHSLGLHPPDLRRLRHSSDRVGFKSAAAVLRAGHHENRSPAEHPVERAKQGIGYGFQQPPRFKGLTVRRLLSLAHGSELPVDECCTYLTNVGLCSADYLNREVDTSLSGGEVKRIEIATLMARNLRLAIYDEPEAGIALWSFTMLIKSFRSISQNRHESTIIISHQERIMQLADDIIVLADGKIKEMGPKDDIFPKLISQVNAGCSFRNGKEGAKNG